MIKLINVGKKYNGRAVLKNITIRFNDVGFYLIAGESGCGKSTLLNILAKHETDYEGTYLINGKNAKKSKVMISYMNQKNIVFADENLLDNIEFSLSTLNKSISKDALKTKLRYVGFKIHQFKTKAKKLSGGEKQRLCYLMSDLRKADIMLCDEITSGLDDENAKKILSNLKSLSRKCLVILVSHDLDLTQKYCDYLIKMEDGKIVTTTIKNSTDEQPILKYKLKHKNFPLHCLMKLAFHKIKEKKLRFSLCVSTLTIGLVTFCLSILISETIKVNLNKAFSSVINKDEVIMELGIKDNKVNFADLNYLEYQKILWKYPEYFSHVKVNYLTNIDSFLDTNKVQLVANKKSFNMPQLSLFSINDFKLSEYQLNINEIILGLNENDIRNISMFLNLSDRSLSSINDILDVNNVYLQFNVSKKMWAYEDERIFTIKRCYYSESTCIYHSNSLFNEIVFEEEMRFKNNVDATEYVPWLLSKQYYLDCYDGNKFLKDSFKMNEFKKYYPDYYLDHNTIILKDSSLNFINDTDINMILKNNSEVGNIKLNTNGSYLVLKDSMISGFSKDFFLAESEDKIDAIINAYSTLANGKQIIYPDSVIRGNVTNLAVDNLIFSSDLKMIDKKHLPQNDEEIIISSSLGQKLFKNLNPIGKRISVGFLHNTIQEENRIINQFEKSTLKVIGVIESEKICIFQEYHWLIDYFRDFLNISNFELLVTSVEYTPYGIANIDDFVEMMNQKYEFNFNNSSMNLSSTINSTIEIVKLVLLIFSFFAISISLVMLFLISYLFIQENSNDFAALVVVGGEKEDLANYKIIYTLLIILSALISTVTIIYLLAFFTTLMPNSIFVISYKNLLNPLKSLAILALFIVAISVSFIRFQGINKTKKISLVKNYK